MCCASRGTKVCFHLMLLVLRYRTPYHTLSHAGEAHGISPDRKRHRTPHLRPRQARNDPQTRSRGICLFVLLTPLQTTVWSRHSISDASGNPAAGNSQASVVSTAQREMFGCQCDANDGERTRFPLLPRFIHGHLTRAEELAARGHCQSGHLAPVQQANGLAITIERPFLFALAGQLIAQRS